jgi:phosphopantothenoylcysteine decarboxylase/phosphopantothenate--cysteine ligase
VGTALELRDAVMAAAKDADAVVMAAAVADFRPAEVADHKIKKSYGPGALDAPAIRLVRNPDVLAHLVAERDAGHLGSPVIVGFAAETGDADGDVLDHARAKLARKGCDLLVVNDVADGKVFGADRNTVTVLRSDGTARAVGESDKIVIADAVWDEVVPRLDPPTGEDPRRGGGPGG